MLDVICQNAEWTAILITSFWYCGCKITSGVTNYIHLQLSHAYCLESPEMYLLLLIWLFPTCLTRPQTQNTDTGDGSVCKFNIWTNSSVPATASDRTRRWFWGDSWMLGGWLFFTPRVRTIFWSMRNIIVFELPQQNVLYPFWWHKCSSDNTDIWLFKWVIARVS